jgi:hypothetical protein
VLAPLPAPQLVMVGAASWLSPNPSPVAVVSTLWFLARSDDVLQVHDLVADVVVNGGQRYFCPPVSRGVTAASRLRFLWPSFCFWCSVVSVALFLFLVIGLVTCNRCLQPRLRIAQTILVQVGQDQSLFAGLLWLRLNAPGRGSGGRRGQGEVRGDRNAADVLAFLAPLPLMLSSTRVVMPPFQHH